MYESYFGLTAPPFLLNPDPSFFFDSRGHSSALSYLKFGLYQAEGFIVVTGDIGAGKTYRYLIQPDGELETLDLQEWHALGEKMRAVLRANMGQETPYLRVLEQFVK